MPPAADHHTPVVMDLPTDAELRKMEQALDAEEALRSVAEDRALSLASFVKGAWHVLEPSRRLLWNWHHDEICSVLEQITAGTLPERQVVICVGPRSLKTMIVSVFWPAWEWLGKPHEKTVFLSVNEKMAKGSSGKTRDLVVSGWYRELLARYLASRGHDPATAWTISPSQRAKIHFSNTVRGERFCLSIGATIIGQGADKAVVDDPVDAQDVIFGDPTRIAERMAESIEWYDGVLSTRLDDPKTSYRLVIMQRLHPDDLAGTLMKRPGVHSLVFPTEFDPDIADPHDHRTVRGELLHEERMDAEAIANARASLKRHYESQHGQRPRAFEGKLFRPIWFTQRYSTPPWRMQFDEVGMTIDASFRKSATAADSAVEVWGRRLIDKYVLDVWADRCEYIELERRVLGMVKRWPRINIVLVEGRANGDALISRLRSVGVPSVILYDPHASKTERAQIASVPAYEAGEIWLPEDGLVDWDVQGFVDQHVDWTGSSKQKCDIIDAESQLMIRWAEQANSGAAERVRRQAETMANL